MRISAWIRKDGSQQGLALRDGERLIDLGDLDLASLFAKGDWRSVIERAAQSGKTLQESDVDWRAPLPRPPKILCIGYNYQAHVEERGKAEATKNAKYLSFFPRFTTCLVAHHQPIIRPKQSVQLDYEGELAVIIGSSARNVAVDKALDVVAGYSIFNDGTLRDVQWDAPQWTQGKNYDRTAGFGPEFVSADELPAGGDGLKIETRLNGKTVQSATTSELIVGVADLIARLSSFTTLEPGTVIATGTPAGVGAARKPPVWLVPGDQLEVTIEKIGSLRNHVADEQ